MVPSTEFQGENIAPYMEHQWRFKQTGKTPGRKKGNVLRLVTTCTNTHLYSHANKEEGMTILDELTNDKNITEVTFDYKECTYTKPGIWM